MVAGPSFFQDLQNPKIIIYDSHRYILYDDMCHLGPFSQNPVVRNLNEITQFFGSRHLAVDCLHFLNHKDKVGFYLLSIILIIILPRNANLYMIPMCLS